MKIELSDEQIDTLLSALERAEEDYHDNKYVLLARYLYDKYGLDCYIRNGDLK